MAFLVSITHPLTHFLFSCVSSVDVQKIVQSPGSDVIYAVGFVSSSQFDVYKINARNGELLKHNSASFPGGFFGEVAVVSSDTIVALDASQSILVSLSFLDGEISFQQTHISNLVEDFSGLAVILPSRLTGMFSIKTKTHTVFIKQAGEGKLEVVDQVNHASAVSDALSLSKGEQAFGLVQHEGSKFHLTVKPVDDWSTDLLKESIEIDNQRGLVQKVFINNYIRTDRSNGFRALIVMEDHSLMLLQQGAIVWSREDGLASVIDVTTSELPVEKGVSVAKVEHNLFEWLKVRIVSSAKILSRISDHESIVSLYSVV